MAMGRHAMGMAQDEATALDCPFSSLDCGLSASTGALPLELWKLACVSQFLKREAFDAPWARADLRDRRLRS